MKLYHGSDHIIKKPIYNFISTTTDYGSGFYMTQDIELAKEWASSGSNIGIVNIYSINLNKLNVLDLTNGEYSPLTWVALLVQNRKISASSPIINQAKNFLIQNYLLDLTQYDIIIGYRADDSYFAFVKAFLRNEITIDQLSLAIRLGKLGKQSFIKSEKAFKNLKFQESFEINVNDYCKKREKRESVATTQFHKMLFEDKGDGLTIKQIMEKQK